MLIYVKFNLVSKPLRDMTNVFCWSLESQAVSWLLLFVCYGISLTRECLFLSICEFKILSFSSIVIYILIFWYFLMKKTHLIYIPIYTFYPSCLSERLITLFFSVALSSLSEWSATLFLFKALFYIWKLPATLFFLLLAN